MNEYCLKKITDMFNGLKELQQEHELYKSKHAKHEQKYREQNNLIEKLQISNNLANDHLMVLSNLLCNFFNKGYLTNENSFEPFFSKLIDVSKLILSLNGDVKQLTSNLNYNYLLSLFAIATNLLGSVDGPTIIMKSDLGKELINIFINIIQKLSNNTLNTVRIYILKGLYNLSLLDEGLNYLQSFKFIFNILTLKSLEKNEELQIISLMLIESLLFTVDTSHIIKQYAIKSLTDEYFSYFNNCQNGQICAITQRLVSICNQLSREHNI